MIRQLLHKGNFSIFGKYPFADMATMQMYQVVDRPNHIGSWLNVPHLKALALRILNLVSDSIHDDRFGRGRVKRVRVGPLDQPLVDIKKYI